MALVFCTECGHQVSTKAPQCPSCGKPPYSMRQLAAASRASPTIDPPRKFGFLAKTLVGLVCGVPISSLVAFLLASPFGGRSGPNKVVLVLGMAATLIVALREKSASKAWRRLLLTLAVLFFLLPISGLIFTGSFMSANVHNAAQATG